MALFGKKKKDQKENKENKNLNEQEAPKQENAEASGVQLMILNTLNARLGGTFYDNCVIMPRGYTIDVKIVRNEKKGEVNLLTAIFVVNNDDFDEPLIDPVDAQGKNDEDAAKMAVDIFCAGVWHPLSQSMEKKNPIHIPVNYLMQHYDFDMYCQSVVRIDIKNQNARRLVDCIGAELPKYLGSKKYYWLRIYLARIKSKNENGEEQVKDIVDIRLNGSVCTELRKHFKEYMDKAWADEPSAFICEKQYAIFVQREEDQCPFTKQTVVDGAKYFIDALPKINSKEEYEAAAKKLDEITGDKSLAAEIRIFVPEIFAKLLLGYQEGDSLFLLNDEERIEFRKTQLRSYFYIQQTIQDYLSTKPPKEDVHKIVRSSIAFRELGNVLNKAKENGQNITEKDLFVPGTSFKIAAEGYKVW